MYEAQRTLGVRLPHRSVEQDKPLNFLYSGAVFGPGGSFEPGGQPIFSMGTTGRGEPPRVWKRE